MNMRAMNLEKHLGWKSNDSLQPQIQKYHFFIALAARGRGQQLEQSHSHLAS